MTFDTKILTFVTFEIQNSFLLTYFSVIIFKSYIKMNADLFLGFCISSIINLHQGLRVYVTFIDA